MGEGTSSWTSQSPFLPDTRRAIKVDLPVNPFVRFFEGIWFVPVDARCFEDEKEFSAIVLSQQLPCFDVNGTIPQAEVNL